MSADPQFTAPDRKCAGEDGVALIMAMLAVIILAGLSIIFVATATFESRSTSSARDYESAIHVAEAAIDDLIPTLNSHPEGPDGYVTETNDEAHVYDLADDATERQQRDWALAIAEAADPDDLVRMAGGEAYAIRPEDSGGNPLPVIYSVGWVPNRDNPVRRRIVRVQFDSLRFVLDAGLLVGGPLNFGGDACVTGTLGSIHANGNITPQGGGNNGSGCGVNNGWMVEQDLTTAGSFDDGFDCSSNPEAVHGDCRDGVAFRPIPRIRAIQLYDLVDQAAAEWYDLCPPGHGGVTNASVRAHGGSGGPCSSDTIYYSAKGTFRGWRYHNDEWQTHAGGEGGAHPGVYYVYQRNARVQNSTGTTPQPVTVIAEEDPNNVSNSGHIIATSDVEIQSALSGLTLVADRDLRLAGNVKIRGLLIAQEQVRISGEPTVTGAVIAQDVRNTLGSMIDCGQEDSCRSEVSGRMTIHYDSTLEPPLGGRIRITHWNEL